MLICVSGGEAGRIPRVVSVSFDCLFGVQTPRLFPSDAGEGKYKVDYLNRRRSEQGHSHCGVRARRPRTQYSPPLGI